MEKKIVRIAAALVVVGAGIVGWRTGFFARLTGDNAAGSDPRTLALAGNVDDRQVDLAFLVSERVAEICVEEGDVVRKGDPLGTLETVRTENEIAEAEAAERAAKAAFDKAVAGSRAEDVAIAEAAVKVAESQIKAAENAFRRNADLVKKNAASEEALDKSEADCAKAKAELELANANLLRTRNGSRAEDVDAARAAWERAKAALEIRRRVLVDSRLVSPCDGVVRSRILEPGEIATPQTPALTLAVSTPKWVRVYVDEPLLPKIKPGDKAKISADGLPGEPLDGWVGHIAPNAEFTPKNVETKELRPALVYEVRVFVDDPANLLKLGAPATVEFPGTTVER